MSKERKDALIMEITRLEDQTVQFSFESPAKLHKRFQRIRNLILEL